MIMIVLTSFIFQLDDAIVELDAIRANFREVEKKQVKFDQRLEEEKMKYSKMEEERDSARRELRDRETKVKNLYFSGFCCNRGLILGVVHGKRIGRDPSSIGRCGT